MKKKQDMHVNCVNTPEHSKYQKMENWTAQNINQYQSKVNEREKSNDAARKYVIKYFISIYIYIYLYRIC